MVVIQAPIFREEACPCPTTVFETPADDLDGDAINEPSNLSPPTNDAPLDTPTLPESPCVPSPTSQDCPLHSCHAPPHFNPDAFGAHGHWKEVVANAYEDFLNGTTPVTTVVPDLVGLVFDDVHLMNAVD